MEPANPSYAAASLLILGQQRTTALNSRPQGEAILQEYTYVDNTRIHCSYHMHFCIVRRAWSCVLWLCRKPWRWVLSILLDTILTTTWSHTLVCEAVGTASSFSSMIMAKDMSSEDRNYEGDVSQIHGTLTPKLQLPKHRLNHIYLDEERSEILGETTRSHRVLDTRSFQTYFSAAWSNSEPIYLTSLLKGSTWIMCSTEKMNRSRATWFWSLITTIIFWRLPCNARKRSSC